MPDGQQTAAVNRSATAEEARYIVPGLRRGLDILRSFSRDRRQIGAPEMARELGIPRSTVFRLVQTLEHMGFLERVETGSDYRLGVGVLSLGFEFIASLPITDLARPVIERLRDATGHSAHLAIRDGRDVIFIVKAATQRPFNSSVTIGTRLPAHGTVLGRMILADLDEAELAAVYPEIDLAIYSDQTPRDLPALRRLLDEDRRRGYAVSAAFFEAGVAAVAAPVRDESGRVAASINISFQNNTVETSEIEGRLVPAVCRAAAELSALLNYCPEKPESLP